MKCVRRLVGYAVLVLVVLMACGCHSIPVKSSPPGATVIINGKLTQYVTPAEVPVRDYFKDMGEYIIDVRKDGYETGALPKKVKVSHSPSSVIFSFIPIVFLANFHSNNWNKFEYEEMVFHLDKLQVGNTYERASNSMEQEFLPVITIVAPEVKRGVKITAAKQSITVKGLATSKLGIDKVTVNNRTVHCDSNGIFSADVYLEEGDNVIEITATDLGMRFSKEHFTVVRPEVQQTKLVQTAQFTPSNTPASITNENYYALIIGNNEFYHLDKLKTAVNDAVVIEKTLKDNYGFKTKLLLNATRKDIVSALNDLRKRLSERDNLLVYYAGHGEFDRTSGKAYWLPVDAQRDDTSEWIIADDITSSIKRISSKHILIVSDSCYSGTLTRSAQTSLLSAGERKEYLHKMATRPSRTLMASGGNEPVADGGGSVHSIFAESFLNALRETDHLVFTADELFYQSVKSRVAGRSEQLPEYNEIRNSGHEGGDFVFRRAR